MQTSRRFLMKGGLITALGSIFGATAVHAAPARRERPFEERRGRIPTHRYDLVIAGLGIGGIVTAIRAKQLGLEPVIVEKMSGPAGNTIYAAGFMLGVHSKLQQEKGVNKDDTPEKFYEDMMTVSQGRGDKALTKLVAEKSDDAINWMVDDIGVQYAVGNKLVWPQLERAHLTVGEKKPGGSQLMAKLMEKAKELDIPIVYKAKVVSLVDNPENGDILGVKVKTEHGYEEYLGTYGTVLATGGYSANKMLLTMMAGPAAASMPIRGSHTVTGESILLTAPYYPQVVNVDQYHSGPIHGPTGANPLNIVNNGIAVDTETKRYTDEGQTYVQMSRDTAAKTKGNFAYMIVDADTHELPILKNDWASYDLNHAPVYKANSIEELAKETGLNPEGLKAVVDDYNKAITEGKTGELTPPNSLKEPRAILKPPFYAVPFSGGMTATFGGPLINTNGQVLDTENKPIPGLFAVGNAAGGLFYDNYVGGAQLTSATVIGREIAAYIADEKKSQPEKKEHRREKEHRKEREPRRRERREPREPGL
ncbi:MAG: FAD-binding protein [Burkholderiales bacterium]|nr:FAD-binding protein [Burkholderiales bacterium]